MSEADGHSFEYNKRHGLIWHDTEDDTYHPVITTFLVCCEECKEEFEEVEK